MAGPFDPEELAAAGTPASAEIPAATRLGPVHLTVSDLDRSVAWYASALGLRTHGGGDGRARLGAGGEDLLVLEERPGARSARGFTGLFHFALLLPARADLARWLAHVARERVQLTGLSDHYVSEAIYLDDPDDHGIEVYWDRPRHVWEGQVAGRMTTLPLDVGGLLGELAEEAAEPFEQLAAGTVMGHVHLRVADVGAAIGFYRDVLGFGLMASFGGSAAFLGAGGYHHHFGANSWESAGAPPAPPDAATITRATVLVPDAGVRDRLVESVARAGHEGEPVDGGVLVRDPSSNPILLAAPAPA